MLASTHHELEDLGGGRFRHTQHMKPIASYKNGSLRRDPFALSATGSAAWPVACDGVTDVRINPRIAGKSPLLHMGHGSHFVRFSLVGANNVSGTVSGNAVTFVNAWNGADLRYTYGGHRVQEDILLRTEHPRQFGFILQEHTGFDPVSMTVGGIRILDPVLEPPTGSDRLAVPLKWLVTQRGGKWQLTMTLPQGDWAGWTIDPTLTLQPGAADGKDCCPNSDVPTLPSPNVPTGSVAWSNRCLLFWFDVSSIPATAVIGAASLTLTNTTAEAGWHSATVFVQRILAANSNWTESGACWRYRVGTTPWAGSDGCSTSGTDYDATPMGTFVYAKNTPAYTAHVVSLDVASVTAWVGGANYGCRLWSNIANALRDNWATSDYATASYRPKLVVEYTLPAGLRVFPSAFASPFAPPFV